MAPGSSSNGTSDYHSNMVAEGSARIPPPTTGASNEPPMTIGRRPSPGPRQRTIHSPTRPGKRVVDDRDWLRGNGTAGEKDDYEDEPPELSSIEYDPPSPFRARYTPPTFSAIMIDNKFDEIRRAFLTMGEHMEQQHSELFKKVAKLEQTNGRLDVNYPHSVGVCLDDHLNRISFLEK